MTFALKLGACLIFQASFCLQAMSQHRSLRSLQHRASSRQPQPSPKPAGCGVAGVVVRGAAALSATMELQSKMLLVGASLEAMCLSSITIF